ncbi:MAG: glycosyltransferase, partial [Wenzhouxiangellaceae bacterium]
VSVIVPVYNQLHYTSACLESLLAAETRVLFEVIVVDDCSSDDTRAWLKQCTGIRHVRNRSNLGFIGSCNRGAKKAAGQWLVFLNNDTRVTDGWLDALINTFAEYPDAGIVGGKLVFGDGTLQEAGGIIFADGSGWNYGRGDDPGRPDYGFVCEADYVSGACLAIERERFLALGGFDRHFLPAYYEDTDLCFKVRAQGLKILYQPAASVIHYEGGTSGTDESAGIKQHQVTNCQKFRERWAETLADYPENPQEYTPALALAHRYRNLPRRALVIDATTPMPDHDSGSVRLVALLRLLDELGYRTSFMPQNLARVGRHSAALEQAGIEVLTAPWITDPEPWLAEHGRELDLVMVSRHYVLAPLIKMIRAYCPNARLVFDTVDLHFLREQREAELAGSASARKLAEKTRSAELGLIRECDATFVVSEFEKNLLADLVPDADVRVVSNIHSLRDPGKPFAQRRDLVFVGGFQHPPNIDAADWLIDDILPRVREQLPEVSLHLIGSRMPERIAERREPGLRVHGFVEDLEAFMTGCRISVAPLRYGAGVKGKVNQAMSHGLPVVATSCAAEGMYAEHEVDILMADDAEGFAAEVVRLYRDAELWNRLAVNGRANVERHFSVAAARR